MSTLPDNDLDLEKLFLPAWAQEPSSAKYADYEGERERPDRGEGRRGPRPPRRDGGPGFRREGPPGARREAGPGFRREGPGPARGDNRTGDRRGPRPEGRRDQRPGDRFGRGRPEPRERREPPAPPPEINIALIPDDHGVESLARQIKMTGRAYPLFEIAQMILQKPERHIVSFAIKKDAEGKPVQPLFVCALDDTLWLSEDEAVAHVLRKHFGTFYQAEKTATEPPKGKYTFVAQCGLSGTIFGPPNYHDYQVRLRKLHADRFSRMPFEVYKSRVRIVRDEEVVKKWVEDQSWKTEYTCLNVPEASRLATMEAVEKHFRETHKDNIIKPVESHKLTGAAARNLRSPQLTRLVREIWEDQRRFPLQIATVLSQQFASHGLQFFKVNKTVTHVSVARPHFLDLEATPVSEGVKRIVDFINAHPKTTRRHLVEALAPSPPAPTVLPVGEGQPAPETPAEPTGPTPEQTAVISDLHWLVHQGHVIEFANGILETAKKPVPKPPKPEPKQPEKSAETAAQAEGAPADQPAGAPTETEGPAAERIETSSSPPVTPPAEVSAPVIGNPEQPVPAQSLPEAPTTTATEPPVDSAPVVPEEPPAPEVKTDAPAPALEEPPLPSEPRP